MYREKTAGVNTLCAGEQEVFLSVGGGDMYGYTVFENRQ